MFAQVNFDQMVKPKGKSGESISNPQRRILAAARDVFLERGLAGARMQEIARRAGINKALLHYYFRSKDDLFEMVLRQEIHRFFEGLFQAIPQYGGFPDFLRSFIHNYLAQLSRNPALMRFILWELEAGGERAARALSEIVHQKEFPVRDVLLGRIQQAVEAKEIRSVDAAHFLLSLIGMCVYPMLARPLWQHLLPEVNESLPQFLLKREEEIFKLIWNGVKP